MKKFRRAIDSTVLEDSTSLKAIEYNPYSGAQKGLNVGPALVFLGELSSAIRVNPGDQLFIFKPSAGISYVTLSETPVANGTAPAEGVYPIFGEQYTVYSAAIYNYIIGEAGVFLYKLMDDNKTRVNP